MRYWILVFALALLCPGLASATAGLWNDHFSIAGKRSDTTKNCNPVTNGVCWYDVVEDTAATHTTPILDVRKCENFSYAWSGDLTDNTETANLLAGYELKCATIDGTNHDCAHKLSNADLDGNPATATNTAAVRGTDAGYVYFVADMNTSSSATGRIRFSCFPRRR